MQLLVMRQTATRQSHSVTQTELAGARQPPPERSKIPARERDETFDMCRGCSFD